MRILPFLVWAAAGFSMGSVPTKVIFGYFLRRWRMAVFVAVLQARKMRFSGSSR